jgi:hypothetical protein
MIPSAPPAPAPEITSSRPVLRLVALAAGVVVVLLAIWWTGAVGPRVRVHHTSSTGQADPASGWAHASFEITNDGRFPVEVESVSVERDREVGDVALYLRDPDVDLEGRSYPVNPAGMAGRTDLTEMVPFELSGRSSREVVLLFEVRCPGDWPTDVRVEVSSAAGVTRNVALDGPPLGSWSTPNAC